MGQGGECEGGIIYWPGKHNPGQSRNLILVCIREDWEQERGGGGLQGDSAWEIREIISKVRKVRCYKVKQWSICIRKEAKKRATPADLTASSKASPLCLTMRNGAGELPAPPLSTAVTSSRASVPWDRAVGCAMGSVRAYEVDIQSRVSKSSLCPCLFTRGPIYV